jgi:S-methylmethionine-dependent homocysteine/selenocysteine methylase
VDRLGVPAWLSLTTLPGPDGEPLTRRGEPAAEAFAMAAEVPAVLAVGVNCVAPQGVAAAVRAAATASGGRVAVAYPNSGETWDGPSRTWRGRPGFAPDDVAAWTEGGARLVGGCCRVGPEQIAELAAAVRGG